MAKINEMPSFWKLSTVALSTLLLTGLPVWFAKAGIDEQLKHQGASITSIEDIQSGSHALHHKMDKQIDRLIFLVEAHEKRLGKLEESP